VSSIFFLFNTVLLLVLALGIFSWVNVEMSAEQKSHDVEQSKKETESLERKKEAWERYASEMKKGFSDLLMNEARERAGVQMQGEGVLSLQEGF
jgi:cell division protein FtsB